MKIKLTNYFNRKVHKSLVKYKEIQIETNKEEKTDHIHDEHINTDINHFVFSITFHTHTRTPTDIVTHIYKQKQITQKTNEDIYEKLKKLLTYKYKNIKVNQHPKKIKITSPKKNQQNIFIRTFV